MSSKYNVKNVVTSQNVSNVIYNRHFLGYSVNILHNDKVQVSTLKPNFIIKIDFVNSTLCYMRVSYIDHYITWFSTAISFMNIYTRLFTSSSLRVLLGSISVIIVRSVPT